MKQLIIFKRNYLIQVFTIMLICGIIIEASK